MARPEKRDVDYFPFYAKRGKTLNIVQGRYGLEGIGFFTNLLRFLALTPDHYYCIENKIDRMNFFTEIGMPDVNKGIEIIDLMVETEKLDKQLWENHKVIVCPAFLESVKDAYKERKNKIITIEEIRAKFDDVGFPPCSGEFPPEEHSRNSRVEGFPPEIEGDNPQSKVKYSKVKKTKENTEGSDEPSPSQKSAIELSSLLLSAHRQVIPDFLSGKNDKKTIDRWAKDIEMLIRIDKKTPETIREVILWAKADNFWFSNIASGKKLREKYEALYGQMKTRAKSTGPPVSSHQQQKKSLDI